MVIDICLKYVLSYRIYILLDLVALELYQLLQYSYDCSSVMSVHLEGGGCGTLEYPLLV